MAPKLAVAITGLWALSCLSACVASSGETAAAPTGLEAEFDPDLAQLRGRVLDDELRGLNATIVLRPLDRTTMTDAEGVFEFRNVDPGEHDLLVYSLGHEPQGRGITLAAGETLELTFTLRRLAGNDTFHQTFIYSGHEACQWYVEGTLSHCTLPYTAAHGAAKRQGVNLTQYGLPPDLQQNKAFANFSVGVNHTGIVSELVWRAQSAGATIQAMIMMCPWYDPVWDECVPPGEVHTGERISVTKGKSPIRLQWTHPDKKQLEMAPFVWSRANVNGDDSQPVGIAFEQKIDFYNTVFYGLPPPDGFMAGPSDG